MNPVLPAFIFDELLNPNIQSISLMRFKGVLDWNRNSTA